MQTLQTCAVLDTQNTEEVKISPEQFGELLKIQQAILELVAVEFNKDKALARLCTLAESILPNSVASIMLQDSGTGLMSVVSAPSVPQVGIDALQNLKPGPGGGSCGNAVFHNNPQFVSDTFTDDRWRDLRQLAYDFNLCACWSMPIRNNEGKAHGSFALSSFEHRSPSSFHKLLLEIGASLVSVILKHDEQAKMIEEKNASLELAHTHLEQLVKEEVAKNREKDAILIKQSRQAAMGEMISNIAHQWRQPLNGLGIAIQDLKLAWQYGEVDEDYINNMIEISKEQIKYMSQTIDDFRAFFKPSTRKDYFTIDELLSKVKNLTSAYNVDVKVSLIDNASIYGFKNELIQVLLNIINNAKDAADENKIKFPKVVISTGKDGNFYKIYVEDNGGGIPPDVAEKIFDPYFTTKFKAQGTGLGLYMAKTIIEDSMNGKIIAENIDGGARFTIALPLDIGKS